MRILLCASIIVSGCSFIPKNQTKSIPKRLASKIMMVNILVNIKKKRSISEKHKDEAIKNTKTT